MIHAVYNIGVFLFGVSLKLSQLFSPKAKEWLISRSTQDLNLLKNYEGSIWFHVSSLGELEQAYPLIERFKAQDEKVVVSFFSLSGYKYFSKYPAIDHAFLLPLDSKRNAKQLLKIYKPKLAIWVKYDFFFNFFKAIQDQKIAIIFIALKFFKGHFLFHKWSSSLLYQLKSFTQLFAIDKESSNMLAQMNFTNFSLSGDTRVTRVIERKKKAKAHKSIEEWKGKNKLIIFASLHLSDLPINLPFIEEHPEFKFLIFPHDISPSYLNSFKNKLSTEHVHYDEKSISKNHNICLVDQVGLLFESYDYADLVYVGGGFEKAIHNILEPTVYQKPTLIGPKHKIFWEAQKFLSKDWIFAVTDANSFSKRCISLLEDEEELNRISQELSTFYKRYPNAVNSIFEYCQKKKWIES